MKLESHTPHLFILRGEFIAIKVLE